MRRNLLPVSALLAAGLLLTACGATRARPAADLPRTITIDPHVGETFAPPPADASPRLSAQQAWAAYTKVDTSYTSPEIPSNVSVRLGLLTLPLGPSGPNGAEAYTAHDELVYGFSWHNCPVSRNPRVRKLPPNPCREWNFLDARTAKQIDETWQY